MATKFVEETGSDFVVGSDIVDGSDFVVGSDIVDGSDFVVGSEFVENKRIKLTKESESEALNKYPRLKKEIEDVSNYKLLFDAKDDYERLLARLNFGYKFSFICPTATAIAEIKRFVGTDKVLELKSCNGYWAKLLKLVDIDVLATDIEKHPIFYIPIEQIGEVEAVKKYKDRNVLMLICPECKDWVDEALQNFTGNKLIFAGEYDSCATEEFYERRYNEWDIITDIESPEWYDINCDISLYIKK
jgi:hypothetical protein